MVDSYKVPAIGGILVTYLRPTVLAVTLRALESQTLRLDPIVVVDNDPDESARDVVAGSPGVLYSATGFNAGPAGGYAHGLRVLPAGIDWVMFLDDDDPPASTTVVEQVASLLAQSVDADPRCGAVGAAGALFDRRTARSRRPNLASPLRMVSVDWIGSGQFPIYNVECLQQRGVPTADLFWGFEDLEIGLALRSSGRTLYRDGAYHVDRNAGPQVQKPDHRNSRWRAYYTTRNLVFITRRYCSTLTAVRAGLRSALGRTLEAPRSTRLRVLRLMIRAVGDGLRGRLGRSVEPEVA